MNAQKQETGFQVVDHYDPQLVKGEKGPQVVGLVIDFLKSLTPELAVALLNSVNIGEVFADEMERLRLIRKLIVNFQNHELKQLETFVGMLEKLHGEMLNRRGN
jgi:hypothetical protein